MPRVHSVVVVLLSVVVCLCFVGVGASTARKGSEDASVYIDETPPQQDDKNAEDELKEAIKIVLQRAAEKSNTKIEHPPGVGGDGVPNPMPLPTDGPKQPPENMAHPEDIHHPNFGDVPPEMVEHVGQGKNIDYSKMSPNEALDKAVVEHDFKGINESLARGANPSHKKHGHNHVNVILQAAETGYSTLEAILTWNNSLYKDAVNTPLEDGHTPLHESLLHGRFAHGAVFNLLKAGADCSHVGPHGFSAVHYTALNPHMRSVMGRFMDVLLKFKCDITVPDLYGRTAVHMMGMSLNPQNMLSLEPHVTEKMMKAKDTWGMTPQDIILARPPIGSAVGVFFNKLSKAALSHVKEALREPLSRPGTPSDTGGWYYPPKAVKYDIDYCEIDRIDAKDLTPERFLSRYYSIRRPFILTGATKGWSAHQAFRKSSVLQNWGNKKVRVGERPRALWWGAAGEKMRLKRFVAEHMKGATRNPKKAYPWMLDEYEITKQIPTFTELFRLPSSLGICSDTATKPEFHMGPVHANSVFLANGHSSIDAVIYGRRRLLLAHETVNIKTNRYEQVWDFMKKKEGYKQSRKVDNLYECSQGAGDVLVLPAGWRMAYINVAETLGIKQEFCNGKLDEMSEGHNHAHLIQDYYGDFNVTELAQDKDTPELPPDME